MDYDESIGWKLTVWWWREGSGDGKADTDDYTYGNVPEPPKEPVFESDCVFTHYMPIEEYKRLRKKGIPEVEMGIEE